MTTQICLTHSIMDCGVPATVMARSVELGNMSPATCTWAPADCGDTHTHTQQQRLRHTWNKIQAQTSHKGRNMTTNLSDFLDLAATLSDEWATLAGRHDEAHGDWRFAGGRTVSHWGADVLKGKVTQQENLGTFETLFYSYNEFPFKYSEQLQPPPVSQWS